MDIISAKLNAIDSAYLMLVKHLGKKGLLNIDELANDLIKHGQGYSSAEPKYGELLEKIGHRVKEFA